MMRLQTVPNGDSLAGIGASIQSDAITTSASHRPDETGRCALFVPCNFIKIHSTLRITPAMTAGVTTRLYDVADLVALVVESESKNAAQVG
jgi:hypothetical protein